jgi:hypothetical protein
MDHPLGDGFFLRTIDRRRIGLQLLTEQGELSVLRLSDLHTAPSAGGALQGGEGQLQTTVLIKEAGNHFGASTFLTKAAFDQIGGAHIAPMRWRQGNHARSVP